jgi:hypothetical protein
MSNARSLQEDQIRIWNDHDEQSWVGLFDPDATFSGPGGAHGSGTEMAKTFYHIWQDAFPDNQLKALQIVDGESAVVLEGVFEGTHTATLKARLAGQSPLQENGLRFHLSRCLGLPVTSSQASRFTSTRWSS